MRSSLSNIARTLNNYQSLTSSLEKNTECPVCEPGYVFNTTVKQLWSRRPTPKEVTLFEKLQIFHHLIMWKNNYRV